MASVPKQRGQRPVKSPSPSVGSSILKEKTDSEINFESIKQYADEAEKDITPTEKMKFKKHCDGLENAIKDKADLSGSKIIAAVGLLIKQLGPYKQSKPRIKTFCKKLDDLKKLVVDGGRFQWTPNDDSQNSPPKIKTSVAAKTKPGSRSPMHGNQQLENIDEKTQTSTNDKTEKRLFDEMKEANKNLADLVKKLQNKHTELIGNITGVLLDNADSPKALVSDLRHLSESFATHIEQNKLSKCVNQWLTALKTDIEKGQITSSFEGDKQNELTTTKQLLQDIGRNLTNNWTREHNLREDLISQQHETEKKILSIWKHTGRGKKTSPELKSSDALTELETFITETKQYAEKQTQEMSSLETELEILEKEIEDLSKLKMKRKDSPSQRVMDISQTLIKWRKDDKSDNESKSLTKKLSAKIAKIWTQSGNGNDKKEKAPEPLKMLDELEKCIKDNKAALDNQTQQTASLEEELDKLEKEMEDLLKQTMKQTNKTGNPSQRVKVICQTLYRWRNDDKSDNESKSLAKKLSVKITKIWTQSGNGNDKKEKGPEPLKMLDELEKCINDNKAAIDKQKQETTSLEVELEKLEKEMEDLLKETMKQKNKTDNPSQRVKVISQSLNTWRNDDKSDKDSKSLAKKLSSRITDVWSQIGRENGKTNGQEPDPMFMLDQLESRIKENKELIDSLQSTEQAINAELKFLKNDVDNLQGKDSSEGLKSQNEDDSEPVNTIKTLRATLNDKTNEIVRAVQSRSAKEKETRNQVAALRQIAFGSKTKDVQTTVDRDDVRDVASQLEEIAAELQPLEKLSEKIEKLCSDVHLALTGEPIEADEEESVIGYLKGSYKTLQKLEKANRELDSGTQVCDQCVEDLQKTHQTLSYIFQYNEPETNFKKITEKIPQRMHGLVIVVTKLNNFVDYSRRRHFVDSGLIRQILENMQVRIVHGQHKEPRNVGQNSQRKSNSAQGNITSDPTSEIIEICQQVTKRYAEVEEAATKLENEKIDLLNRLSKLAGANLTNNNPNIADLSDSNRPTKLAEIYSELYDNAWTDAFEKLEKSRKNDRDTDLIQDLFEILSESYQECADISKQQQLTIVKALTEPTSQDDKPRGKGSADVKLSALQSKAVTELRKQTSDIFGKSLQSYFEEKYKKDTYRKGWFEKGPLQKYTLKCIELCWLMQVQAPPVYIELKVKSGEKFDANKFKQYTKSGNKIDFVVWPPLLLNEGGPLLCKGVAQGK